MRIDALKKRGPAVTRGLPPHTEPTQVPPTPHRFEDNPSAHAGHNYQQKKEKRDATGTQNAQRSE